MSEVPPLNKKSLNLIIIQIYLIKFCQLFAEDQDVEKHIYYLKF